MELRKLIAALLAFSLCVGMAPSTLSAVAEDVASSVVAEEAAPSDAAQEAAPSDAAQEAERKAVADMATLSAAYPNKFDLRDKGVVTPVKTQYPFGSCWSFAGIAAAETSALTTLGMTFDEYKEKYGKEFDLSEKHLVWYALHPVTELTDPTQAGEGMLCVNENAPNATYDDGGQGIFITSLFAAGIGPVTESAFPYRGKEGITHRDMVHNYPERTKAFLRATAENKFKMTLEEVVETLKTAPEYAEAWFPELYAYDLLDKSAAPGSLTVEQILEAYYQYEKMVVDAQSDNTNFSPADDWSIPDADENGASNRDVYSGLTLLNGNVLPDLSVTDEAGNWAGINPDGIAAVKDELMAGRAVSVAFKADQARPGETISINGYMDTSTWAHYTDKMEAISHAVCIVGWDDDYPAENFADGHEPPGNGAWIVKNSWGSETEYVTLADGQKIGNNPWGVVNDEGKHTGYFYLSYYDKAVKNPESMEFDIDLYSTGGDMGVLMYDYMPSTVGWFFSSQNAETTRTANVFLNDSGKDMRLFAVSTYTSKPDATVEYAVYLLNDNAQTPEDGVLLGADKSACQYAGFHRERLNGDIVIRNGEKFSIVATETVKDDDGNVLYDFTPNLAPAKEAAQKLNAKQYGVGVVNKGESFVYSGGEWTDLTEFEIPGVKESEEAEGLPLATDNFRIKAYVIAEAGRDSELPETFDLRDKGVVTPVKSQNPWQTCWAFSGIAAAETSILSSLDMTAERYKQENGEDFDLSEKHLSWFALSPVTEAIDPTQVGEGLYKSGQEGDPTFPYNNGGHPLYITTLFSSGIGPVLEKYFPYWGAEKLTSKEYAEKYSEKTTALVAGMYEAELGVTLEEIFANPDGEVGQFLLDVLYDGGYLTRGDALSVELLADACYRLYLDNNTSDAYYSNLDDWSIPDVNEADFPNRNYTSGYTLTDGNTLPDVSRKDAEGNWIGINPAGIRAVKFELLQGRGVSIAFKADQAIPGESISQDGYMNPATWAHYADKMDRPNHAVCIVGWDDNYPASNFVKGHEPPGNGAWIVKNSWGSETDYVVNENGNPIAKGDWGVVNDKGEHTGFFYLSYYDQTVCLCETMAFDTDLSDVDGTMSVWMYDYMPATDAGDEDTSERSADVIKTANVFKNDTGADARLYAVSTRTYNPDARVKYSLYLLDENAQNPEQGQLLDTKAAFYDYAGFHREKLSGDITIKNGQTLSIVAEESVIDENGNKLYAYSANAALRKQYAEPLGACYGVAVVNKGESYIYKDGKWTDWSEFEFPQTIDWNGVETPLRELCAIDNFSIKAYVSMDAQALLVKNGTGGGLYPAGDIVTVTADEPAAGKQFDKWTFTPALDSSLIVSGDMNSAALTFKMPACDISAEASYQDAEAVNPDALTKVDAKAPTCTEDGYDAYWKDEATGKLYSDAAGAHEISGPPVKKATGHDWNEWVVTKEATTDAEGEKTRTCKNDPSHTETRSIPKVNKSVGGCYVATSVYGSYDCPEVWTLRRFRDDVLAGTWYGRLFIRAYYAVSPTAVKLFGDCQWFRDFFRDKLDKLVAGLQADGFASTPYEDAAW